jgi:hypothetical protein
MYVGDIQICSITSSWQITHVNLEWNSQDFESCWFCINPCCLRQWLFPKGKLKVKFILMQLTDRARFHCSYLSWKILILHIFLKLILVVNVLWTLLLQYCCSCAMDTVTAVLLFMCYGHCYCSPVHVLWTLLLQSCSGAVDTYCRCKLHRITGVMFVKQRLFSPELCLILTF